MAKVSIEIEAINNTKKALSATLKQLNKVTKAVEKQQKVQDRSSTIVRREKAAVDQLNKALEKQYISRRIREREKLLIATGQLASAVTTLGKAEESAAKMAAKARKSQTDAAYKERTKQINAQKDAQMKADRAMQASAEKASKEIAASRKKAEEESAKAMRQMAAEQDKLEARKLANIQRASKAAQQRAAAEVKTEAQISKARAKGFAQAEKAIAQQKQQDMAKFMASKKLEDRAASAKISAARSAGKAAAKEINKELTIAKRSAVARAKVEKKAAEKIVAARVKAAEKSRKAAEKSAQKEIALSTKLAEKKVRDSVKAAKAAERAHERDLKASKRKNEKILRDIRKRREANAKMQHDIARKAQIAAEKERKEIKKTEKAALKANRNKRLSFTKVGKAAMRLFFIIETLRRMFQALAAVVNTVFIEPIKSFAAFETGMAEVSTLLGKDISKEARAGVAGLTNSVKDLAIQFGKAPVDMAKALYFAVSAGATEAKEAQEVLRVSTMLSTAGLIDAETATRALVTVMNAYGISFMDAEQVSDLFFITVQKGITTVKELANKVGRVAGIAASAGMSIQTMFAFIAAGTKVTGLTTATVTGLRSAIQLLLKPGKTARDRMKALGISFGQAALKGDNFSKWVTKVRERMRGMTEDGKKLSKSQRITSEDLAVMLPNLRAQAVVMGVVASKTNLFATELKVMQDAAKTSGATAKAVNKIMDTFAFKMQRAKSALEVVKIEFGQTLVEGAGLKGFLDGVAVAMTGLISAFRKFKDDEPLSDIGGSLEVLGKELTFFTAGAMLTLVRTTFSGVQAFTALALSIAKIKGLLPDALKGPLPLTNEFLRAADVAQDIARKPGSQLKFPPIARSQTTDTVDEQTKSLLGNVSAVSDIYEKMVIEVARRKVAVASLEEAFAGKREDPLVKRQLIMDRAALADLVKVTAAFKARRDALIEAPKQQAKEEQRLEKSLDATITALQRLDDIAKKVDANMRKGADASVKQGMKWKTLLEMLKGDIDLGGGGGTGGGGDKVVNTLGIRKKAMQEYFRFLFKMNEEQKEFMGPPRGPGRGGIVGAGRRSAEEKEIGERGKKQTMLQKQATKEGKAAVRQGIQDAIRQERGRLKDEKKLQKERLADKKKNYMADTFEAEQARNADRENAFRQMTAIQERIDRDNLTEEGAKKATEEAKTKILAHYEGIRHGIVKQAMAAAVRGYVTEEEIAQQTYDSNIEMQLAAIAEARALYAEKLALIEQTSKSEVEIELRKEQAKLEIMKQFTKEGEVNKKKAATKGISIAIKDRNNDKKLLKQAQREEQQRVNELSRMAESAASTVVSMGSTLIKDLLDKEKTATEAFKNLGLALLEMAATSLAEFVIGEGIKAFLITSTTAGAVTADQIRLASGMSTDAALVQSSQMLAAQRQATNAASSGGGMGLAGILGLGAVAAAIFGIGGFMIGKSIQRSRERDRAATGYGQRLYSKGGLVTGGTPGMDSVSALLTPGEYVLNKSTVDSIRKGTPPSTPGRYASGGFVMPGAGAAQIVFAPNIQTVALPSSVQNQRYYRDTVSKSRAKLAKTGRVG
jgi:TP901 family phage tail tape measure protein